MQDKILEICILVLLVVLILIVILKNNHQNSKEETNSLKHDNDLSNLKNEIDNKLNNNANLLSNNLNQYLENFKVSTNEQLQSLNNNLKENVNGVSTNVKENTSKVEEYLDKIVNTLKESIKELQTSNNQNIEDFKGSTKEQLQTLNDNLKENVNGISTNVKENTSKVEEYLNKIVNTLQDSIKELQTDNNQKLEEMRKTVDEKLETTLNKRLTESFQLVQENLDKVSTGLGEMKQLATGVGDLKKVLTNVKTRGIWGEVQLGSIISEILTKDQYATNIATKPKSKDPVEFAVKLPGDGTNIVYLPIDSKFPLDAYEALLNAYEEADKDQIEKAQTSLKQRIKLFAKTIQDKYIETPFTTDFGIMFLPIEGLYAEVAKLGLIEDLQNTYHIIISGPTTISALLNSLQVGFRTLAIEKRSSEVWNILAAVKTQVDNFEGVLKNAQNKINQANEEIETLVGTRTRQIQRKLKEVTEMDYDEAVKLIETE